MTKEQELEGLWPFYTDTNFRDTDGSIMPWYTKMALEWIKENIPSGLKVLEFGGGHSTLWWRKRAEITTIEYDPQACRILGIEQGSPLRYFFANGDNEKGLYDIVIIDSEAEQARQDYVLRAFDLSKKYVIIDNYQQPGVCMYNYEVVNYLKENSKEHFVFNEPSHNDGTWQTAIFIK